MGEDSVFIMNAAGDCVASSNADKPISFVGANFASRDYFREAMDGKKGYQYAMGKITNIPGLFFSEPIILEGRIVGVVTTKVNLRVLSHLVNQADSFLTDKYGVIILASDAKLEMRSLPGAAIVGVSREARIDRYKRDDFPVITVNAWPGHWRASVNRFDNGSQPLVLTDKTLDAQGRKVYVYRRLPEISGITQNRLRNFFLLAIFGIVVFLIVRSRIIYLRVRAKAEDDLRTSARKYQLLFESSRDALMTVAPPSWKFSGANQAALQLFGASSLEEFTRIEPWNVSPEFQPDGHPSSEKAQKMIRKAMLDGSHFFEWEHQRLNAQTFTADVMLTRLEFGGEPFLLATVRDITEQKLAADMLRKLSVAVEQSPISVVITDLNAIIQYVNPQYAEATCYSAEEAIGRNAGFIKSGHTPKIIYQEMWNKLTNGMAWHGELFNKRKNGELYWEETHIAPVKAPSGNVTHYVAAKIDITERKLQEKQIVENEQRLIKILNVSPIAVRITVKRGQQVVFYNPSYADLLKNPEAMGDDPKRFYANAKDYEEILDTVSRGNAVINRQIELNLQDRSTVWTLASYMSIQYQGEDAVLGWFYDITKLKQTEETLQLARLNAEATSSELKGLHERNVDDMAVASNIMSHIMRSEGLNDPQIRYFQKPAHQFSGDIIAAARDNNGDLRVMLADVTGHGLQAALFLLPVSRVFYSMVKRGFMTGDIVREMNQTMREITVTGRFIAAAVAHVARDGSSIEIWNGGIPSAVHVQQNGEIHNFRSQHLPLGVLKAEAFDAATEVVHVNKGALLLCSDGLIEAENASGEPFGDALLEAIIQISPPDELFKNITSSLETHLGGCIPHDDLSIVLAQCGA
jgi:PAS domain S-box-containing protein